MTIRKAPGGKQLDRIVEVASELRSRLVGDGPFSLCEARLDEQAYESLSRWVEKSLSAGTIRSGRWEVGAVVFHFITETARRDAHEGSLWSSVRDKFPAEIRSLLFLQGQPLPRLKDMIDAAVQELHLRHVLDRDDTLKWYVTTYLQFGCTHQGLLAHLPQWLCGAGMTTAVEFLLSGALASESFRDVWQALRYYRRDWVTEHQVRS
ncbi:MAG TPA: hypothetical protein PK867_21045, partial [Pirellulales bacterium]|nr:hypothetical protein [Pirellulales bacterium]